jgi:hypothetical protein
MKGLDDNFWDELLDRIYEREVVPLVGPGAVTFGRGDELLYPWLAAQVAAKLDPPLMFEEPPRDLQEVVDAQRIQGRPVKRIITRLCKIVEDPDLRPGPTLSALAGIEGFKLFISTTFDPLLPCAVESASPGGKEEERRGAFSSRDACPDLPQEIAILKHPFVYQILGRATPRCDFVVWDEDMFHFLPLLDQKLKGLNYLSDALQNSHFLVIGLNLALLTKYSVQFTVPFKHQKHDGIFQHDLAFAIAF